MRTTSPLECTTTFEQDLCTAKPAVLTGLYVGVELPLHGWVFINSIATETRSYVADERGID